ncbi:polysaccharide deacetylase family protein [candidate division KSB1 bacterium]|nr:polysaccharide deacetylase family protein [candidate division KSB1 bacterium]
MKLNLPENVHCAAALSYDLEMCAGYSPTITNNGRIMPELQKYTLALCDVAERYNVSLHFFYVTNGLEERNIDYLKEILARGHTIDSHTYSHVSLAVNDLELIDEELSKSNVLLENRLGVKSVVLRGPGGILNGLNGKPETQRVILKNGFSYVSSAYRDPITNGEFQFVKEDHQHAFDESDIKNAARLTVFEQPYRYETGLIEIPMQGLSDRNWFDTHFCIHPQAFHDWRKSSGHQPVAENWRAPWTPGNAIDRWIQYNLDVFDLAYQQQTVWMPVWHPYTHYLHDRENIMLKTLLQHAAEKPEKAWMCTVRDVISML